MSFSRPTLSQIKNRVESDIKSGLGLLTILARSFLSVLASALAGASHTLHGYIAWALDQFFPDTAEETYLVRWGNIFGIDRLPATFAEIEIEITGTDGVPVPDTTIFQRSDGAQFQVKDEVTPSGGSVLATIVALESGDAGNISDGSEVTLSSPIVGIDSTATVTQTLVSGEDQETLENLRTRLLERMRNPPAGGTVADYIAFAKTVVGVTRVWVFPGWLGQGTVGVSFVEDDESPIIPIPAKVDEVQAAVDERKPIEALVTVFAPTATAINPSIRLKPNTVETRAAITAELEDLVAREAQVRGAIDPDQVAEAVFFTGKIPLSKINEAISVAAGEDDHELLLPLSTPQPSEGGILTLGTITFSTMV
jgi:uncharacterized phage protein gp47/JayE